MFGQDRRGRSVIGPDVLEYGRVAGLLRMMIDDEIDPIDHAAEIVRLHVHHGDPVELLGGFDGNGLHVDVEQVHHPEVLWPRHPLHSANDRRRPRATQNVSKRQAARHGVRVRIVVQHDQDAVGVAEVALILQHACAGQRPGELR